MLQVQHLTLTHTKDLRTLVDDLSFTVSGQDRLAVIGEEGDGKSTLLSVIASWPESPAYCQVTGHVSGAGEHFAYLAQDQNAVDTSVYEFCMRDPFFASALWEDLADACRQVDLDMDLPYAASDYTLLSGGEKVRLRLMLLLLHSPSFLLLDEPSNDLDIEALEMLERFLLNCHLPVIYISHDEMLLRRTATRVLHLESVHGRSTPRWTLANVPYERYVT
ncbi:MAG: ABC-F family ATP-binding cassette domain-containing protein, partial [Clostridia bacterium]|nr:ABC-F family ATP-binding cassette domain-containing protein [Clostridia bacterium]